MSRLAPRVTSLPLSDLLDLVGSGHGRGRPTSAERLCGLRLVEAWPYRRHLVIELDNGDLLVVVGTVDEVHAGASTTPGARGLVGGRDIAAILIAGDRPLPSVEDLRASFAAHVEPRLSGRLLQ